MNPPIKGMTVRPFGEEYMVDAWSSCMTHAAGNSDAIDAFRAETGFDLRSLVNKSPLAHLIDSAAGYDRGRRVRLNHRRSMCHCSANCRRMDASAEYCEGIEMHTKTPWTVYEDGDRDVIYINQLNAAGYIGNLTIFQHRADEVRANARRIVACVNACEDIPTEKLEAVVADGVLLNDIINCGIDEHRKVEQQRDELLAMLKDCKEFIESEYRCGISEALDGHHLSETARQIFTAI